LERKDEVIACVDAGFIIWVS